jgi:hypothetical protein
MKNAHFTIAQCTLSAQGAKLLRVVQHAALVVGGVALLAAGAACTTTTQRAAVTQPVARNSTPSSMSELRIADTALESGDLETKSCRPIRSRSRP